MPVAAAGIMAGGSLLGGLLGGDSARGAAYSKSQALVLTDATRVELEDVVAGACVDRDT